MCFLCVCVCVLARAQALSFSISLHGIRATVWLRSCEQQAGEAEEAVEEEELHQASGFSGGDSNDLRFGCSWCRIERIRYIRSTLY